MISREVLPRVTKKGLKANPLMCSMCSKKIVEPSKLVWLLNTFSFDSVHKMCHQRYSHVKPKRLLNTWIVDAQNLTENQFDLTHDGVESC